MDELGQQLLDAAPCDWGKLMRDATAEELSRASDYLGSVAAHAAYLCRYTQGLQLKRGGMCIRHKARLRASRSALKATRKACDYSYPADHPLLDYDPLAELDD